MSIRDIFTIKEVKKEINYYEYLENKVNKSDLRTYYNIILGRLEILNMLQKKLMKRCIILIILVFISVEISLYLSMSEKIIGVSGVVLCSLYLYRLKVNSGRINSLAELYYKMFNNIIIRCTKELSE